MPSQEWKDGRSKDITFIVTKDCQLACKYCYLVGKNHNERMSVETAKAAVDYILDNEHDEIFDSESVVFNFIGGEPFLEIDLIDWTCDYLKMQMYLRKHHWFNSYRISITTNGINYDSPKVQKFIQKNIKHLSITITIDGTRRKHDINRIWKTSPDNIPERHGSYDSVVRNVPLWLQQFPDAATKVTISSPDIPYVCESVLHLFGLGIHTVSINCVFEDVWNKGDDLLLEEQMRELADEMYDSGLHENYECSLFDRSIGYPMDARADRNWCGAGLMLAIDAGGNFYPCTRFAKYALRDKPARIIGNVKDGIYRNLLRPYYSLTRSIQSNKECIECDVASGCAWCQGENYDCSDTQTIFQRSTAICRMHKARVRANRYFWSKVDKGLDRNNLTDDHNSVDNRCALDKTIEIPKTITVLLSSQSTEFCMSNNPDGDNFLLPLHLLQRLIDEAVCNKLNLQFVYPETDLPEEYLAAIDTVPHKNIVPAGSDVHGDAVVFNSWTKLLDTDISYPFIILRTTLSDFYVNVDRLKDIFHKTGRINIVFTDEASFSGKDEEPYSEALDKLVSSVHGCRQESGHIDINILTDRLGLSEMDNCNAGLEWVTLGPNGYFYVCPDFYYNAPDDTCGSLEAGLDIKNTLLYKLNHAPLCNECGAYHCQRCVFLNKRKTLEVNIPSYEQCRKSELELEATKKLYSLCKSRKSI